MVYVDGYNVYHGLRHKDWKRYLWLDYRRLFELELGPNQRLAGVKYFTATNRQQSHGSTARQQLYLRALEISGGVDIRPVGRFKTRPWKCKKCGKKHPRPQEKRTDVAIAVEIVHDAHSDAFDTAWLMCADADLVPAVEHVKKVAPDKVVVVLPPRGRRSDDLIKSAHAKRDIRRSRFSAAQFPDTVDDPDGGTLERPPEWM